jgi:signal transduction histidine kinase/CheY-like chemotaxis protein
MGRVVSEATRVAARALFPYYALVLLGALPLVALVVFAYLISARSVVSQVRAGNDAVATMTAALLEGEAEHWSATLISHARFPALSAAVAAGDVAEVRRRLHIVVDAHHRLDRAFVTDLSGRLWVDYPEAPESLGRRFDDRDWYRGVMAGEGVYISAVYRRNAEPQRLVVGVATRVFDPATGEAAGLMVAQVRLAHLSDLLRRVEVGAEGIVFLLDHTGTVAAHPSLDPESTHRRDYADILTVLGTDADGGPRRGRYADPFSGEMTLASAVTAVMQTHGWTVVSQQPLTAAFATTRALAWRLAAAGVVTAALMGGLILALGRENARRWRAEEALLAMNADLEQIVSERTAALRTAEEDLLHAQKMEAVGRLAGGIAHDFNNLLTVILGSTELLLEELPAKAPARREAQATLEAALSAAKLTQQLLAFSRKQVMQPRIFDLSETVEGMRGIIDRVLGENIDLVWRLSAGLHPVKFDPGQIEQVLLNLVVNASDAMPRGGKLTIATDNVVLDEDYVEEHPEARTGPHAMVAVSDTGSGMDAATRERIFDPYFTTKKLGRGTGLGLSTAYGIVRQGGGNIWVYSELGRGTTFKVYLPRTDEAVPETTPQPSVEETAGTGLVLVVEDEPAVRSLLVRILESAGYGVLQAGDVAGGRAMLRDHGADLALLLTDVVLPDGSGPELAEDLHRQWPALRVLFMSGYSDDAIFHHGVLEEGAAFIEKPLRPKTLLDRVREVLASGDGPSPPPGPDDAPR